jgi:hypothetical protein
MFWLNAKGTTFSLDNYYRRVEYYSGEFYGSVRNITGGMFRLSSYTGPTLYPVKLLYNNSPLSLSWCLMKDSTSNNIFVGIVKKLQRQGKDKATHHAAISEQDHEKIKKSTAGEPDN